MTQASSEQPEAFQRAEAILAADVGGQIVLMDPEGGAYFELNPTATEVWRRLEQPVTIEALVAVLAEQYGADAATIEQDLRPLLDEMRAKRLIKPSG